MITVTGKRYTAFQAGVGTDQVIMGFPIPRGGILKSVKAEIHLVSSGSHSVLDASLYGLSGYVIPLADPDNLQSLQDVWDIHVPKANTGTNLLDLDLDEGGNVSGPEFEPGEQDLMELFDLGARPRRIYRRRKMVSFASRPVGHEQKDSAEDFWVPTDLVKFRKGYNVRVSRPSYVLFGLSSPTLDATSVTQPRILTEGQWFQYTYFQDTLTDAWKGLAGGSLIEGGQDTLYLNAMDTVRTILSQIVFEEQGDEFKGIAWGSRSVWEIEVAVPGTMAVRKAVSAS